MATKAKQLDPPEDNPAGKVKAGGDKPGEMTAEKKPRKTVAAKTVEAERELVRKFDEWTVEIGEKTDQCFDNHPRHILKVFPKVDEGRVTEAHLAQRLWWWRRANEEEAQSIFRHQGVPQWAQMLLAFFRGHFEHSAYLYELRARFEQRHDWAFGYPWVYCSRQQRRMLDCLWPNPYPAQNWLPSDDKKPEWVRLQEFTINLSLNDSVHVAQFVEELKRLRREKGIHSPAAGQGVRRKPIVWRAIELLDIRRYKLRDLNDSERSQVSKALLAYKTACSKAAIQP